MSEQRPPSEQPRASEQAQPGLRLDEWLDRVRRQPGLSERDLSIDRATERALLDLTRIAARSSERIAGPITAYLVGLAAAGLPEPERSAMVERLVAGLEASS